ncbi:MAG: patatin-like phospholipase family protein [Pseudomonadota bacterium]
MSALPQSLAVRAGPAARAHIEKNGFDPADVRMMVGASGGAKWLVLAGLDRALIREVVPKYTAPVHLLGSSIGAWRFSCYAQNHPMAALERFEHAYLTQTYSEKPDREEITRVSRAILENVIGESGAEEIVNHPVFRSHIMVNRARHLTASEHPLPLAAGLTAAMLANKLSRKALGAFFVRTLVHDPRERAPFYDVDDLPIEHVALSADNVAPAVLASGAIPFVLSGVKPLPGARPGTYRDGGITDYHFDVPLSCDSGITLYPHFYEHLVPGWFDKRQPSRKPRPEYLDRVLLLAPSQEFVSRLPGGRIPDRNDFRRLDEARRLANWRRVVAETERLGDAFLELVARESLGAVVQPIA